MSAKSEHYADPLQPCIPCGCLFQTELQLNRHFLTDPIHNPHQICPSPGCTSGPFKNSNDLFAHVKQCDLANPGVQPLCCDNCVVFLTDKADQQRHVQTGEHQQQLLSCTKCIRKFQSVAEKSQHTMRRQCCRPDFEKCRVCGKYFYVTVISDHLSVCLPPPPNPEKQERERAKKQMWQQKRAEKKQEAVEKREASKQFKGFVMPERNGKPGQWRKNKRQQKKYQKSQQGPAGAPQHSATAPGRSTDISQNATVTSKSAPFSSPSLPATRRSRYSTTIELGQEDEVVLKYEDAEILIGDEVEVASQNVQFVDNDTPLIDLSEPTVSSETTANSSLLGSVPSHKSLTTLSSEGEEEGEGKNTEEEEFPLIDLSEPSHSGHPSTPPLSATSSTDESCHDQDKLDIPEFPFAPPPSYAGDETGKSTPQISDEQWEKLWEKLENELTLED